MYSPLVSLRRGHTASALLVKDVKYVDHFRKDCISRSVRFAIVIISQLHNLPAQAFAERASTDGMIPILRVQKCPAEDVLDISWQLPDVTQARADP